jgi:hypothetical protein
MEGDNNTKGIAHDFSITVEKSCGIYECKNAHTNITKFGCKKE